MEYTTPKKSVVLCSVDGLGLYGNWKGNAFASANPNNFNKLSKNNFFTALSRENPADAEIARFDNPATHSKTMLSGVPNESDRSYLDNQIKDSRFYFNNVVDEAFNHAQSQKSAVHLIGNLSGKFGRFGDVDHLLAFIIFAKKRGLFRVFIHLVIDDSSASKKDFILKSVSELEQKLSEAEVGEIATICGNDYISKNGLNKLYKLIVNGDANRYLSASQAISQQFDKILSVNELEPSVIFSSGQPVAKVFDFDSLIFFNHNNSNLSPLVLLIASGISADNKRPAPKYLKLTTIFSSLDTDKENTSSVFNRKLVNGLPEIFYNSNINVSVISDLSRRDLIDQCFKTGNYEGHLIEHILPAAENGRYLQDIVLNTAGITEASINVINAKKSDFIYINFPIIDFAAKTGSFNDALKAVKAFDDQLLIISEACTKAGAVLLLASPYGNAEKMIHRDGYESLNAYTLNPTPLLAVAGQQKKLPSMAVSGMHFGVMYDMIRKKDTILDVAPTVLGFLGLSIPEAMPGHNLLAL